MRNLLEMEMHEVIELQDLPVKIMRVPGGWIYTQLTSRGEYLGQTFVPEEPQVFTLEAQDIGISDSVKLVEYDDNPNTIDEINKQIKRVNPCLADVGQISDGYHTFNELYKFRLMYNAALFNQWQMQCKYDVHKSRNHHDGKACFGGDWFIVMANLPTGQISNHYEMKHWDLFEISEFSTAQFEYDGHTSQDVLERLRDLDIYGEGRKKGDHSSLLLGG